MLQSPTFFHVWCIVRILCVKLHWTGPKDTMVSDCVRCLVRLFEKRRCPFQICFNVIRLSCPLLLFRSCQERSLLPSFFACCLIPSPPPLHTLAASLSHLELQPWRGQGSHGHAISWPCFVLTLKYRPERSPAEGLWKWLKVGVLWRAVGKGVWKRNVWKTTSRGFFFTVRAWLPPGHALSKVVWWAKLITMERSCEENDMPLSMCLWCII